MSIQTSGALRQICEILGSDIIMDLQGRRWRLTADLDLSGVEYDNLREAMQKLATPCTVRLVATDPKTCGSDNIMAVNLSRPLEQPPDPIAVESAIGRVTRRYPRAARVKISHLIGGPCDDDELACCIVFGGIGQGWTVVKSLERSIELAFGRAAKRHEQQGHIHGGQTVKLTGLHDCPELNNELGIALHFESTSGRWLVRLQNGEGKQLRPQNLQGLDGAEGRVFAFWGQAMWSRTQLLGEVATGAWGLCRANVGDLAASPEERMSNLSGRLAFAPVTEMSEDYMRQAQQEMDAARAALMTHDALAQREEQPEGTDDFA
eukprot:TRINITY_DN7042_c0_g1_i2.p1 TRINITY_DN7042_c0_g1~~TRINITY_DN7042_c0_g1_i2.p1  ORF type:complete len:320 (+),score=57.28 TRINITY_DN7042_c0_g1_i2:444-1403(+)